MKIADYDNGFTCIKCDMCRKKIKVRMCDFRAINKELTSVGWLIRKEDGVWKDYCKNCKEKVQ